MLRFRLFQRTDARKWPGARIDGLRPGEMVNAVTGRSAATVRRDDWAAVRPT